MCVCLSRSHGDARSSASAHQRVKVLRLGMSKVTAYAAIRGDGRVCVAETDGMHSWQYDG